jgi:hypothetical protein
VRNALGIRPASPRGRPGKSKLIYALAHFRLGDSFVSFRATLRTNVGAPTATTTGLQHGSDTLLAPDKVKVCSAACKMFEVSERPRFRRVSPNLVHSVLNESNNCTLLLPICRESSADPLQLLQTQTAGHSPSDCTSISLSTTSTTSPSSISPSSQQPRVDSALPTLSPFADITPPAPFRSSESHKMMPPMRNLQQQQLPPSDRGRSVSASQSSPPTLPELAGAENQRRHWWDTLCSFKDCRGVLSADAPLGARQGRARVPCAFDGAEVVDKICFIIKTTYGSLTLLLGRALDAHKFFHGATYDHRATTVPVRHETAQFIHERHERPVWRTDVTTPRVGPFRVDVYPWKDSRVGIVARREIQ